MFEFDLQLFGGIFDGGGGGDSAPAVKASAPGATAAASIEGASAGARQSIRDKLSKTLNRRATQKTNPSAGGADTLGQIKKQFLGE